MGCKELIILALCQAVCTFGCMHPTSWSTGCGCFTPACCSTPSCNLGCCDAGCCGVSTCGGCCCSAPAVGKTYNCGTLPYCGLCKRHYVTRRVVPVIDECIKHVPVAQKKVRTQTVPYTCFVPVVKRVVVPQHETIVTHVPVQRRVPRTVVDQDMTHVEVRKEKTTPYRETYQVIEPRDCTRNVNVVDCVHTNRPVISYRCRHVPRTYMTSVPVTRTGCRPVVDTIISQVPVKQSIVRNVCVQNVVARCEPCCPCGCGRVGCNCCSCC